MKRKSLFWGILLILAAILIVFGSLGYLSDISVWKIVLSILFIGIFLTSLVRLWFVGIFFPLAFLIIMYDVVLGLEKLTPWPVLAIALLGSIGFSLIFSPLRRKKERCCYNNSEFKEDIEEENGDFVECFVKFGSSVKYIKSENFQKAVIKCSFGAMKVYFDQANLNSDYAEIVFDVSFGGVEVYIPKEWNVINQIDAMLGGVDEKGKRLNNETPTVVLKGSASFSGVEIHYI